MKIFDFDWAGNFDGARKNWRSNFLMNKIFDEKEKINKKIYGTKFLEPEKILTNKNLKKQKFSKSENFE